MHIGTMECRLYFYQDQERCCLSSREFPLAQQAKSCRPIEPAKLSTSVSRLRLGYVPKVLNYVSILECLQYRHDSLARWGGWLRTSRTRFECRVPRSNAEFCETVTRLARYSLSDILAISSLLIAIIPVWSTDLNTFREEDLPRPVRP